MDHAKILEILEQRTSINSETNCWEYAGTNTDGYGQVTIDHEFHYVHRLSAIVFLGYSPNYSFLHVLHRCKSKNCWNPAHLYIGDNDQNIRDKMEARNSRNQNTDVTHCKHGHEFTPENTYWGSSSNGNPRRYCRECRESS